MLLVGLNPLAESAEIRGLVESRPVKRLYPHRHGQGEWGRAEAASPMLVSWM